MVGGWKAASLWLTRRRPREWNPDVVRIAEESVELLLAAVAAEFADDPAVLERVMLAVSEFHAVQAAMPAGSADEIQAAHRRERTEARGRRREQDEVRRRVEDARKAPPAPVRGSDEPESTFEARTKLWEEHYATALSAESALEHRDAKIRIEG